MIKSTKTQAGDTIVEVMIAIAVAAFAIATSYAIANHSLQTAINARDRNEALNIIESQIAALKFREKTDPTNFGQFEVPSSFTGVGTAFHFCLDTGWPTTGHPEGPQPLGNGICNPVFSGVTYNIDISAMVTATTNSPTFAGPRTVYKVEVQWPPVGNIQTEKAAIYYRF